MAYGYRDEYPLYPVDDGVQESQGWVVLNYDGITVFRTYSLEERRWHFYDEDSVKWSQLDRELNEEAYLAALQGHQEADPQEVLHQQPHFQQQQQLPPQYQQPAYLQPAHQQPPYPSTPQFPPPPQRGSLLHSPEPHQDAYSDRGNNRGRNNFGRVGRRGVDLGRTQPPRSQVPAQPMNQRQTRPIRGRRGGPNVFRRGMHQSPSTRPEFQSNRQQNDPTAPTTAANPADNRRTGPANNTNLPGNAQQRTLHTASSEQPTSSSGLGTKRTSSVAGLSPNHPSARPATRGRPSGRLGGHLQRGRNPNIRQRGRFP